MVFGLIADPLPRVTREKRNLAMESYPLPNQVFELSIEVPFPGIDVAHANGHIHTTWRFVGDEITQAETRCFKLVSIGAQKDFSTAKQELRGHGYLPPAQYVEAFRARFPKNDKKGSINVGDSVFIDPCGRPCFATIRQGNYIDLQEIHAGPVDNPKPYWFPDSDRYLVEVRDA